MKKRAPYKRIRIEKINRAEVKKDNEDRWRLISIDGTLIYRVWLMGIVTNRFEGDNNYIGLDIEDGSGMVRIKSWDGLLENIDLWEKIELLGQIQICI